MVCVGQQNRLLWLLQSEISEHSQNTVISQEKLDLSRTSARPAMEDLGVLFQPHWESRSTPLDQGGWPGFYMALGSVKLSHPYSSNSLNFISDPLRVYLGWWFYGLWNTRTRVVHHKDEGPLPPLKANFQEAAETYNFFSSQTYSWEHVHYFNWSLHCWLTAKWPTRCLSLYCGWSRLWCSSSFFLHWQPGSKNVPDIKGNIFKSQVNSQQYTNDSACRYYKTVW